MSGSKTKEMIIRGHLANELLQARFLPAMLRNDARDLRADQPTMVPAEPILENSASALEQGNTHYVDVQGVAPLREAFGAYLETMGVAGYEWSSVLVTAGVQEARFLSIQKIGENFGKIAMPAVVHPGARKALGVRPMEMVSLPVDEGTMLPSLEGIQQALEDGCQLLYLESPVRLTGVAFDDAAVAQIADLLVKHDAAAIWDQGLAPWVDGASYVSLASKPGMAERVALLGEGWPGMGLESWMVGYVSAKPDWAEPMRSQKQIMAICTSTATQFAAVKAAELYPSLHSEQLSSLAQVKSQLVKTAEELNVEMLPTQVVNLVAFRGVDLVAKKTVLNESGFLVVDGADFGAPGILRLSVAADGAAVDALKEIAQ